MSKWWDTLTPRAPARTHLLLAGSMWTLVGGTLLYAGVGWVLKDSSGGGFLTVGIAALLGLAKARFVLSRTADRIVTRIRARGDRRCLGGVISWWTWGFVLCMVLLGRVLRAWLLPIHAAGFVYTAVGLALLTASRHLWAAWYHLPMQPEEPSP